jgi:hypothetical protein
MPSCALSLVFDEPGYAEGKNIKIERRQAEARPQYPLDTRPCGPQRPSVAKILCYDRIRLGFLRHVL